MAARFFLIVSFLTGFSDAGKLFSQKTQFHDFIIWENGDTAYCQITSLERASGNIRGIDYLTSGNRKIELRTEYEVSKVKFIGINDEFFWEYLPVKAKKPVWWRHLEIELNGKIKVYANKQLVMKVKEDGTKYISDPTAKFGGMSRTIKLDNGKYLDITPANIKNEIAPYLQSCPEFKNSFKEKVTRKNILQAVKMYNQWCK